MTEFERLMGFNGRDVPKVTGGGWSTGGIEGIDEAVLSVIAGAQLALRLSEHMKGDSRTRRIDEARSVLNAQAAAKLSEAGITDKTFRLDMDNSAVLKRAFTDGKQLGMLINAMLSNPVSPFQVKIREKERLEAVEAFADDLGCPESWVPAVRRAVEESLRSQETVESTILKAGVGVLGIAVIVAAPYAAIALAPAGLAGGAAILSGLAGLGPGGMLGGLAVVGAIAASGGGMVAGSLVAGDRKQVQQNVVFIQSMALAKRRLRPWPRSKDEWRTLVSMRAELEVELAQHRRIDDRGSSVLRDISAKLGDVNRALNALSREGIGEVDDDSRIP